PPALPSCLPHRAAPAAGLAFRTPAVSVTYYPLGCTGATIRQGLLGPQSARERPKRGTQIFPRTVRGQIDQLTAYLGGTGINLARRPDLIFLTVGGNDLKFSGLGADLLVANDPERRILRDRRLISAVTASRQAFGPLAEDFKALRRGLLRLMGGDLEKVVFVNYANPAMYAGDKVCPSSRRGVDAHPAFALSGSKVETIV